MTAAEVARSYVWPNGQADGILPSRDELNLLWENYADSDGDGRNTGPLDPGNLGGFDIHEYWSSSQDDSCGAYSKEFGNGNQWRSNLSNTFRVRAVRAF